MADEPGEPARSTIVRTARLATLPIGLAGRATLGVGRRLVGASADTVNAEIQRRTADQMFQVLGELKGGAMKFGQILSLLEAGFPDELAAPYRATLTKLQDAAPAMSAATVHRLLATELGSRWRDDLVEFNERPAAAASIGQVHRGRWRDGREVAVKLQYPGAAKALTSDLRQIGRLASTLGRLFPGVDVKPLVTEARERLVEELDYSREATAQARFHSAFTDSDRFVVPAVVAHTTGCVVSEWLDGDSLAAVIAGGARDERDHWGRRYAEFLFCGPALAGLLHADPHPGNFKVGADGRLGVVDFGCCARLPDGLPPAIGRLLRIALSGESAQQVHDGLRAEGFIRQRVQIDPEELVDYLAPFTEPARAETFHFTRDWMRTQVSRNTDFRQPYAALAMRLNLPPEYFLIHRVWVGSVAVLCQLDASAPYREILEDWLPGFIEADQD